MDQYVKGECLQMCPEKEINMRIKQKLVHRLEMTDGRPDKQKFVKEFSRSAAGSKAMLDPKNLRPPDILLRTVYYLLDDIISVENVPFHILYDYITDRLRCVRQDLIIQNTPKAHTICILQPIILFHVYASFRLYNDRNFDAHLNNKHLQECLKRLLVLYDECDLVLEFSEENSDYLKDNRPFFEALYLIFNLGDVSALTRALNLQKCWRSKLVEDAIEISSNYLRGNYIRVTRMLRAMPFLLVIAACQHLPLMRKRMLKIMSVAYSSPKLTFPSDKLVDWLWFRNVEDVEDECRYYEIKTNAGNISFLKTNFKEAAPSSKMYTSFDRKIQQYDIPSLILYNPNQ